MAVNTEDWRISMIERTLAWIKEVNEEREISPTHILDVGSYDYNGSPRSLFPDSVYVGVDQRDGPGVDKVMDILDISGHFDKNSFNAVLCLYTFEHVTNIWRLLRQVDAVLAPKGYFYVAVPWIAYPEHNFPKDYWRFTETALKEVIMDGYDIVSFEHGKSRFGKHPIMNCLGVKIGDR